MSGINSIGNGQILKKIIHKVGSLNRSIKVIISKQINQEY